MKEFRTLLFLDWFQGLFTRLGFDYRLLRRILQVKLTMDQRRVPTIFQQQGRKKGKDENRFIKSLWVYALFGLFVIPFIVMGDQYIFQMSITFTVLIFIVMTSMISDFSVVILDIRDHTILFTKPVERKTISLAKTLHVFIYLFFLTGLHDRHSAGRRLDQSGSFLLSAFPGRDHPDEYLHRCVYGHALLFHPPIL